MVRDALVTKRVLAGVLVLALGAGAGAVLLSGRGGASKAATSTAVASRGEIVLTVGGAGRVVEANAPGRITVPASPASSGSSGGGPGSAPPDSVFPSAAGHVSHFLVSPGDHVSAGQVLAILDDGGTALAAVDQARTDVATAQVELARVRTHDPAKGIPATAAELAAARLAVRSATEKLALVRRPPAVDVAAARLDVAKASADLDALRPGAAALASAVQSVDVATAKLAQIKGPALPQDVAAANLEVAKAAADVAALRSTPPAASGTAVEAARLSVTLAQQRIAEQPATATTAEKTALQVDLRKAQADLDALLRQGPAPTAQALAAAQAAVDLASQKLALVTGPPNPLSVAASLGELKKAQADLETFRRRNGVLAVDAARHAVELARLRLGRLRHPPAAVRDAARFDAAKAAADLETLVRRGGPGTPADIELARLKVRATSVRLTAAQHVADRLTVRSPSEGTVTSLLAVPGGPADPATPLATVADLRHLGVSVDLSEFDVAKVRSGQRAIVSVDALGGQRLRGDVRFVAPTGIDNGGVVTFPVRVALAQTAGVKPGMGVSVRIVVQQRLGVVRIPLEAVVDGTVTVVDHAGHTRKRPVTLGLADNKQVEVRAGLRPGERVALGGQGG
jgi:RND family efflux transporter MFP subunit